MKFLKKNWGNIIFLLVISLLLIPQTGMPIKVLMNRIVAFSPSEVNALEAVVIEDYDWHLKGLDGDSINLSESKGKVILVNLWATWCPPCVAEMPSLQKLYNRYRGKVDFYFVSSEETEKLQNFLQKKDYNFPVYVENESPPKILQTQSIPTTYLISKEGKIVISETGAANWDSEKVHTIVDALLQQ